jgi:hypothetical protein
MCSPTPPHSPPPTGVFTVTLVFLCLVAGAAIAAASAASAALAIVAAVALFLVWVPLCLNQKM